MREPIRDKGRLEHILTAIDNVFEFTNDFTLEKLQADKMVFHATIYNVQVIGEAAYMLTKEFKALHPEVEWRLIEGMRHVIVHGYYQVGHREIWNVIKKDLLPLRQQIEKYIQTME